MLLACTFSITVQAQTFLTKPVNLPNTKMKIAQVLQTMEAQGGFYFSYNSHLLNADSMVSLKQNLNTVHAVLQYLFAERFRYHQSGNHVIILAATTEKYRHISGIVVDKSSGIPIADATVYEVNQLVSTMTDEKGAFHLQLKERYFPESIRVSKLSYADTQIDLQNENHLQIKLEHVSYELEPVVISNVERNWLVKHLLSTRQKIHALNLGKFFAQQPFQFSVIPGLGTHGRMSAQVVNKFSLNIFGGYTAGVSGVEIGGLFNISRTDVNLVQIGGLFNVVGGKMKGLQIGGLYNTVGNEVKGIQIGGLINVNQMEGSSVQLGGLVNYNRSYRGMQIAGFSNYTHTSTSGLQLSGLLNYSRLSKGVQISGLANFTKTNATGLQLSGLFNYASTMKGAQIAGFFNKTTHMNGVQIGLVNIADSINGVGIGLINFYRNGYHKLGLSYNETNMINLNYKSGNERLYSIINVGLNPVERSRTYCGGLGLGADINIYKEKWLFAPEVLQQVFFAAPGQETGHLTRLQCLIKYRAAKNCAILFGPALSSAYSLDASWASTMLPQELYHRSKTFHIDSWPVWLGWTLGMEIF